MKIAFYQKLKIRLSFKRVLTNIVIGMVIAILVHFWHDSAIISRIENAATDLMIQLNQGIFPNSESTTPFVFIDIDEATYQAWGEPALTPKDKLALLLRFVTSGKPKLVVIDVDTSAREASTSDDNSQMALLIDLLSSWTVAQAQDLTLIAPSVLFVKGFRQNLVHGAKYREAKPSPIDELIEKNKNFHSVSPLFERAQYDQTIRHWRLFEATCSNGVGAVVPSIQLITVAKVNLGDKDLAVVYDALAKYIPDDCSTLKQPVKGEIDLGSRKLRLKGDRLNDRIIYKIPWRNGTVDPRDVQSVSHNNQQVPLVTHLSAGVITANPGKLDPALFKDRIVIIGGSFVDNRDNHLTPIGMMPGAMVLINAMHSILQYGQMARPPAWQVYGLEFLLILIASFIFALTDSFVAKLISGGITLALLLPLTFSAFKYGLWLDFALPVLGVQIHETITRWERTLLGSHE